MYWIIQNNNTIFLAWNFKDGVEIKEVFKKVCALIINIKVDDIEMPDDIKPSNARSALANVGDDLKIIRDNMPFGNISTNEMGTYFIAYASSFTTVKKCLQTCLEEFRRTIMTGYQISALLKQAHSFLCPPLTC